jgi:cob(I)alamin adenosyltransferase
VLCALRSRMKIYTRTGDQGATSLFGGSRVPKNDPRIEAYGTVDELNSFIGLARSHPLPQSVDDVLHQVQIDLFEIGARLASPNTDRFAGVDAARITELEQAIDAMERELAPLTSFILPGGAPAAAQLHVARTVCRRAERCVVALHDDATIAYLNRLSDYLFVAARFANLGAGREDVPWKGL